jgi:hypothetical protein
MNFLPDWGKLGIGHQGLHSKNNPVAYLGQSHALDLTGQANKYARVPIAPPSLARSIQHMLLAARRHPNHPDTAHV